MTGQPVGRAVVLLESNSGFEEIHRLALAEHTEGRAAVRRRPETLPASEIVFSGLTYSLSKSREQLRIKMIEP